MPITPQEALQRTIEHREIFHDEMLKIMRMIMNGELSPVMTAALLTGLRVKKETIGEITAAAQVMREFSTKVEVADRQHLVDIVGTGGDGSHTFNISTASMFVAAAAGAPDIGDKLKKGVELNGRTYKNHLDGYNQLDYLSGKVKESPRKEFIYVNDIGEIVAARVGDWKVVYMENRAQTVALWREPFVELRAPLLFNLRRDPFERADENSNTYWDWMISHAYVIYMMQAVVPDMAGYDRLYKRLIARVPLNDVSSFFVMEKVKETTALPLDYAT